MSYIPYTDISMSAVKSITDIASTPVYMRELFDSSSFTLRGIQNSNSESFNDFRLRIINSPFNLAEFAGYFRFRGIWNGYLYNNFVALDSRGLGPTNWRVMTQSEALIITNYYQNNIVAHGTRIDGEGSPMFNTEADSSYTYNPTSLFGIGAGYKHHSSGEFGELGYRGSLWTITPNGSGDNTFALEYRVESSGAIGYSVTDYRRNDGRSIRLINTNYTDLIAWQPGDTILDDGVYYNIHRITYGGLDCLITLQNFRGTKFRNGDLISKTLDWGGSVPRMCAYNHIDSIALTTAHY